LSQDDIVFDEIRYREPVVIRRPDRDRRRACVAYEVPGSDDLPVFLDRGPADAIERHALSDTSVELGGILLGKECVDDQTGEPFVWVTDALEAKHYENTQASFTYTHDSWEEISRERDAKHPDLDIVGWYHTHPDFGVFLSGHDLFIQRHFFSQPLQVAYVVDPVRQTRAFFRWRSGAMEQTGGFYLTADRGDRLALARLVNELENVPNAGPDSGGGGLSPRLEAELIAMLTRPATQFHGPAAADRAQTALLYSLLGASLGVLGLAAVLWLNAIHGTVQDQAQALAELRKTVGDAADRQRVVLDAAVGEAGGADPERFLERYARAARERDAARSQLADQAAINQLLAAKTRKLTENLAELQAKNDEAQKYEKDAREAVALRARFRELQASGERQFRTINELNQLLDTTEGRKAAEQAEAYRRTRYAAYVGWALSGVLALGLSVAYALSRLPAVGDDRSDDPPAVDPGTHLIT